MTVMLLVSMQLSLLWAILGIVVQSDFSLAIDCSLKDCYDGPRGRNYRGSKSTTLSGLTCQAWASTTPHNHRFWQSRYGREDLVKNHCRNPDNEPRGPWCYTMNKNKRWEYCLPQCQGSMGSSAVTYGTKWFCAVKGDTVVKVARDLKVAQMALGKGQSSQAIIPMSAVNSGDPHTLAKSWSGGNMWWRDWNDIYRMQRTCRRVCSMVTTTTTTTTPKPTPAPACELIYDAERKKGGVAPRGTRPAYKRRATVPQKVIKQGQRQIEKYCNDQCMATYRGNGLNRCRIVRTTCNGAGNVYWGTDKKQSCTCELYLGVRGGPRVDLRGTWYKCRN